MKRLLPTLLAIAGLAIVARATAAPLVYEGTAGPAKGKQIVFIASDHEYKSEEALPMLGRMLAKRMIRSPLPTTIFPPSVGTWPSRNSTNSFLIILSIRSTSKQCFLKRNA